MSKWRTILLCTIALNLVALYVQGQSPNFAKNGSFEEFIECPNAEGQLENALYFHRVMGTSPDLFTTCGNNGLGIPNNALGEQQAYEGNAMGGIIATTKGYSWYEYIVGTLDTSNMVHGKEYCLSAKISLADYSPYSLDQLAFFFSPYEDLQVIRNAQGYYQRTIYPMFLNWEKKPLMPLGEDQDLVSTDKWMTVKNTITFDKHNDFYFWIGANTQVLKKTTLQNSNQHIFNPDRTVYYYIDDIQITVAKQDTMVIIPELYVDCDQSQYVVTLPESYDVVECFLDSTPISAFKNNIGYFSLTTDLSRIVIKAYQNEIMLS